VKKCLGFLFTLLLSVNCFVFPMKKNTTNALKRIESRIEQLGESANAKDKKTLQIFASLFYYTECLCEVAIAEKLAAKTYEIDTEDFDNEIDDLILSINKLLMELDKNDRALFLQLDSFFGAVDSSFNLKNLLIFMEARRVLAYVNLKHLNSIVDFFSLFYAMQKSEIPEPYKSIFNEMQKLIGTYCNKALKMKEMHLKLFKKYKFIDTFLLNPDLVSFYKNMVQKIQEADKNIKICICCNKAQKHIRRCSRCKDTYYCTIDCQKKHWSTHRRVCVKKDVGDQKGLVDLPLPNDQYKELMKLLLKVIRSSNEFMETYYTMKVCHDEVSINFVDWCDHAVSFKNSFSKLYDNVYPLVEEKKVFDGYRKGRELPCCLFPVHDAIYKMMRVF